MDASDAAEPTPASPTSGGEGQRAFGELAAAPDVMSTIPAQPLPLRCGVRLSGCRSACSPYGYWRRFWRPKRSDGWEEVAGTSLNYTGSFQAGGKEIRGQRRSSAGETPRQARQHREAAHSWTCRGTTIRVRYLGGWDNPRHEKIAVFMSDP